jgi:hypothetical protein
MGNELPLKDIHLPEAITWWPLAIGWWVLIVVIIAAIYGCYLLFKRLTRRTATKDATLVLQGIKQQANDDVLRTIKELSACLRRVAISLDSREEAASLVGDAWLAYLDNSMDGEPFKTGVGRLLVDAPYQRSATKAVDVDALITLCEAWLARQTS